MGNRLMNIDNLKLRTKVLIPLMLMAAVVVAMVAFGATRLIGVSATASDIIEKRDLAAVELTRAANAMSGVPHAVFAMLLYDQDDKARKAAKQDFEALVPEAGKLLDLGGRASARQGGGDRQVQGAVRQARRRGEGADADQPRHARPDSRHRHPADRPRPDGTRREPRHRGRHPRARADRRDERLQRGAARRQRQRQPGLERQSQPGGRPAWRWSASSRPCSPAPSRCG